MCENIRRQKALNTICICAVIALLLSLVFMAIFSTTTASAEDQLTSGADSTISTPSDTAADLGAIKNITIILWSSVGGVFVLFVIALILVHNQNMSEEKKAAKKAKREAKKAKKAQKKEDKKADATNSKKGKNSQKQDKSKSDKDKNKLKPIKNTHRDEDDSPAEDKRARKHKEDAQESKLKPIKQKHGVEDEEESTSKRKKLAPLAADATDDEYVLKPIKHKKEEVKLSPITAVRNDEDEQEESFLTPIKRKTKKIAPEDELIPIEDIMKDKKEEYAPAHGKLKALKQEDIESEEDGATSGQRPGARTRARVSSQKATGEKTSTAKKTATAKTDANSSADDSNKKATSAKAATDGAKKPAKTTAAKSTKADTDGEKKTATKSTTAKTKANTGETKPKSTSTKTTKK